MDMSNLEQQFAELTENNHRLAETLKIRDAEIRVLRNDVRALSGEVIKCLQEGKSEPYLDLCASISISIMNPGRASPLTSSQVPVGNCFV